MPGFDSAPFKIATPSSIKKTTDLVIVVLANLISAGIGDEI
jgi:hypothetical protein